MFKISKTNRFALVILTVVTAVCGLAYVTGAKSTSSDVKSELLGCYFQSRSYESLSIGEQEKVDELMKSEYARMWDESIGSMTEAYHEKINEKFNKYIKRFKDGIIKGATDTESQDAIDSRAPDTDTTEEALEKCKENDYGNYSTYCVAITLHSDPTFGYKGFRDVMACRKYDVFESTKEKDGYTEGTIYQQERLLTVSNKINEATRAITDAKAALDQTLSAYDQMKLAWAMHSRYVMIYEDLIKYRDKLVEVRHFIESFPAKFIDASTTQCT